ncbi:MAG: hypothetical protein IJ012_00395 [Clostridia bacterium]|nr:hypothetical protein [Clostridia bacterium]
MHFGEDGVLTEGGADGGGLRGVVLLTLLLCAVFFLSVGAYGFFAEGEMAEGELPNAILVLRELVEENETVSVFLGFSEEDGEAAAREERILAEAEEYIRAHQS